MTRGRDIVCRARLALLFTLLFGCSNSADVFPPATQPRSSTSNEGQPGSGTRPVPADGGAIPAGQVARVASSQDCWNVDISNAPVDWRSNAFLDFINADSIKRLHPGFGGDIVPGGDEIWGFPYIVLNGSESKSSVLFEYANESDGVDHRSGQSYPFYPIPDEAIWRPHLIQGGFPGNIDHRWDNDRHMLLVDGMNKQLYELDGVYFNQSQWRWEATSGAFFDLNSNAHRPEGWTSLTTAATCRPRVPTTLDGIMISSIQRFTS